MLHEHVEINRQSVWYWITGDGAHLTRWHCTSGDTLLMWGTIVASTGLFILYLLYAYKSNLALEYVRESHFRAHLSDLRNVFVICGFIHVLNSVVSWFVPLYWSGVVIMVVNCWQTWALMKSKNDVMAIQRHAYGEHAIQLVEDAKNVIRQGHIDGLAATVDRLESILRREQ